MFRKFAFAAAAASLMATGACMPITTYSGFQAVEASPSDVKIGEDSKSSVLSKLGSPSATSTFDPNIWFYMSQITDQVAFYQPRVARRDIYAVSFDKDSEAVVSVNKYTLKDGKIIAYNDRETPTRGREMTILEQLLGNVGQGGLLPNSDDEGVPGQRPGDRRN
jgi:outer membrane protein assembly factor BamE (lipoprotein component of BamABCDE complex)